MSTEVQQILVAVRALGSKERQELAMAHVPTSSDAFMARKHEDLASEN